MRVDEFDFELPESLIAQMPTQKRSDSRLMHVNGMGEIKHLEFRQIDSLFREHDLLVRNNVKVMKARLFGRKISGGKLEFLFERVLNDRDILTQIKASKAPKVGDKLYIEECSAEVLSKDDGFYSLRLNLHEAGLESIDELVELKGHMPLPPYIKREDDSFDEDRYQTVYAKPLGAVAAPTAGLHFDEKCFEAIKAKGVSIAELTLYVGSGTFQPVRVDDIKSHHMHAERYQIDEALVEQVKACREKGGRIIALGTTSLRALESACVGGELQIRNEETDIFIYPGYEFRCVDALITNFHLPKSTLLMLVSAFSGKEVIANAYQAAITEGYRFFSYGDAMFLEKKFS